MTGWLCSAQIPASRHKSMCHLLTTAMNSLCKKQERGASMAWPRQRKGTIIEHATYRQADGPSQSRRHHLRFRKSACSGVPSTVYLTFRKYSGYSCPGVRFRATNNTPGVEFIPPGGHSTTGVSTVPWHRFQCMVRSSHSHHGFCFDCHSICRSLAKSTTLARSSPARPPRYCLHGP